MLVVVEPRRDVVDRRHAATAAPRKHGVASEAADTSDGEDRLDYEQFVMGVSEGGRNDAIFRLTCSLIEKRLDVDTSWAFVRLAACNCNPALDEAEARAAFDSAWKRYRPPPPRINARANGLEDDEDVARESREAYQFVDVSELDDEPDFDWIVPGILAPNLLTILGGQARDGKSTWMAALLGANVLIVDSLMFWGGVNDAGGENDSATMQKVMNELVHARASVSGRPPGSPGATSTWTTGSPR